MQYYKIDKDNLDLEKVRLEIAKFKREKIQGWGNGLFKFTIATCAMGTLWLKAKGIL